MGDRPRVCVVSASRQNAFFDEILQALGEILAEAGVEVEESVDCFPPLADDLVYLSCRMSSMRWSRSSPIRARPSSSGPWSSPPSSRRRSGSSWPRAWPRELGPPWTSTHWGSASCSGGASRPSVFRSATSRLGRLGAGRGRQPLDRHGLSRRLRGASRSRAGALRPSTGRASGRDRLTETGQPHTVDSESFWSHGPKWQKLADSKLLLNVHRSPLAYMEWHRVLGAQMNGCVVVTEHCVEIDPLIPGEHFISAGYWQLPEVLGALLEDPERIREIKHAAYEFLREEMPVANTADRLIAAVERVSLAAPASAPVGAPEPLPLPMPVPAEEPRPAWEEYAEHAGESLAVRVGLKHLITRVHNLERHLGGLVDGGGTGEGSEDSIVHLGPRISDPDVSVLLTVHNYADCVAGRFAASPWAPPAASKSLPSMTPPPMTRSAPWRRPLGSFRGCGDPCEAGSQSWASGCAQPRRKSRQADLLFILDADNEVLPGGIARLAGALEEDPTPASPTGSSRPSTRTGRRT